MPGKMSPAEERDWKKSKKNVKDEKDKPQSKFKDKDWGLVQHIFKLRRKKHTGKSKKKKSEVFIEMLKFANFLDDRGHYTHADSIDAVISELLSVVRDSGEKHVE